MRQTCVQGTGCDTADDTWYQVGVGYDSVEGVLRLFLNGVEVDRTTIDSSTDHDLGQSLIDVSIGAAWTGGNPLTDGILSQFVIGASRPDGDWSEFFEFAYETEKALFVASANAYLNGAGDAVLDVSWDPASQKTMAMQSDVINVFTGIERTTDDATPGGWTGTVNKGVAIRTTKGLETVLTGSDEELYAERAAYTLVDMAPLGVSQTALAKIIAQAPNVDAVTSYTRPQYHPVVSLTDGATIAWDTNLAPNADVVLGGNRTFDPPTNIIDGAFYSLRVVQDGTGSRTGSWDPAFHFAGGTVPVLTTTANAVDRFTFQGKRIGNDMVMEYVGTQLDVKTA